MHELPAPWWRPSKCGYCKSYGLCAADCVNAPWNFEPPADKAPWPSSKLIFLLRQRRWLGRQVPCDALFFVQPAWSFR